MSAKSPGRQRADVRIGVVSWPKFRELNHAKQQQIELMRLVELARFGLILECSQVERTNSELVNILMRVRNQAIKINKSIVLMNAPDDLLEVLRACNLRAELPVADNPAQAKQLISGQVNRPLLTVPRAIMGSLLIVAISLLCALVYWSYR